MSKPATRVIKANQFAVDLHSIPPKVVGVNTLRPEGEELLEGVPLAASLSDQPAEIFDQVSAHEEATNILQETETMVKELLGSARRQVEENLQQAREDAENIVLEARDEVDALKEQAREEGYRQGFDKAIQEATVQAEDIRAQARQVMEVARAEHNNIINEAEEEIIALVISVAEKVIGSQLVSRPELVGGIVRAAIQKATDREELVIRVNPEDLEYVTSLNEDLRKETQGMRTLRIIPDSIISRGGCVLETSNGSVDATLERQLSEIREALMEVS